MSIELISIEPSNLCGKACWFCYNHSGPARAGGWSPEELYEFIIDCAANGVKAVSFGGGEPLEYPNMLELLARLKGKIFRSMTSNGLLLDSLMTDLVRAKPDKVHLSVHFPEDDSEVSRVISQVNELQSHGIKSGVNLLVMKDKVDAAADCAQRIRDAGIGNDRIVFLPMRKFDEPSVEDIARVAGNKNFQSMFCLQRCAISTRFCSIAADKTVGWCSYTTERRTLCVNSFSGLMSTLSGLGLTYCGG